MKLNPIIDNRKRETDSLKLDIEYVNKEYKNINMDYRKVSTKDFSEKYDSWFNRSGSNIKYPGELTLLDDRDITVIRASQKSVKSLKRFKHLSLFFAELRNNKISMSNALINWNTARIIQEKLYKCRFLNNFHGIDREKQQVYKKLENFVNMHYVLTFLS